MSAAYFYDAEGRDREIALDEIGASHDLGPDQLVWFDVERGDEALLKRLAPMLELNPETIRTILSKKDLTRIVSFENYFQFTVTSAGSEKPQIDFVVGKEWLLTVRDEAVEYFQSYRDRDQGESLLGRLSPLVLAASLLDWHFEEFQQASADIQRKLDHIDASILGRRRTRPPLTTLARARTEAARMRRRLDSHGPLVNALLRPDFAPVAEEKQGEFFSVLESHFERAKASLERAREGIASSFDLYATKTTQDTNDLVRLLTLVTVATGLGAALAGIFGMNFDIALFHTGLTGFSVAVAIILAVTGTIFLIAWLRGWLASETGRHGTSRRRND